MSKDKVECKDCLYITSHEGYKKTKFSLCQKKCGERGIRKVTVKRNCDDFLERKDVLWD